MNTKEMYRVDQYGTVYEYSAAHRAYICIGKRLPGESKKDAILRLTQGEE